MSGWLRIWVVLSAAWTIGWWSFMGFIIYDRGYPEFAVNLPVIFAVWLGPVLGVLVFSFASVRATRWIIRGFQTNKKKKK